MKSINFSVAVLALIVSQNTISSPVEIPVDVSGTVGIVDLVYGAHTINSVISVGADVDAYQFNGFAGQSVATWVAGFSNNFDPSVELRDSSGIISSNSCNDDGHSGDSCSVGLTATLPADGVYNLTVSDVGNNEPGNYTLHLDQWPPVTTPSSLATNNWADINHDTVINETIGHRADWDVFSFDASKDAQARVVVQGLTNNFDVSLAAYLPDGTLLGDNSCVDDGHSGTSCSAFLDLLFPENGKYTVLVAEGGNNELGDYNLTLTCLTGSCDVIPLPAAAWLFGSGLLGLVGIARRKKAT